MSAALNMPSESNGENSMDEAEEITTATERYDEMIKRISCEKTRSAFARMLSKGRCIRQVIHLAQAFDVDTFSWLSHGERSSIRQESHQECSEQGCIAYNSDMANYQTKHATDDCQCEMVPTPYSELVDIIRDGHVPLVSVWRTGRSLKLTVAPRTKSSTYLAVSHVWADGLGNPNDNALPVCQLMQFQSQGEFWMDTLCVPVRKEDAHFRTASIQAMASIYAGAKTVLILDAELLKTEAKLIGGKMIGAMECLERLVCSVWMGRSWTLQEAALAGTCEVRLADTSLVTRPSNGTLVWKLLAEDKDYTPDSLFELRNSPHGNALQAYLRVSIFDRREVEILKAKKRRADYLRKHNTETDTPKSKKRRADYIRTHSKKTDTVTQKQLDLALAGAFVAACNALSGRSTTKTEDLHQILANMLDMSCLPLLDLEMPAFMLPAIVFSLQQIPVSLFFNTGRRLDLESYPHNRWVPLDMPNGFLTHGSTLQIMDDLGARCPNLDDSENHEPPVMKLLQRGEISCVFIPHGPSPGCTAFCLGIEGDDGVILVQRLSPGGGYTRKGQGFAATFLMVERRQNVLSGSRRGAMFHVSAHDQEEGAETLRLVYDCPVEIAAGCSTPSHDVSTKVHGVNVNSSCEVFIQYDILPLPSLQQHDLDDDYDIYHKRLDKETIRWNILIIRLLFWGFFCSSFSIIDGISNRLVAWTVLFIVAAIVFALIALLISCLRGNYVERGSRWNYVQSFLLPTPRRPSSSRRLQNGDTAGYGTFISGDEQV